jgi:hypothetical protein
MSDQLDESATPQSDASRAPGYPPELEELAREHAGGWVCDIDPAFDRRNSVPREAIRGAWRIGPDGSPTGEFVPNANYRPVRASQRKVSRAPILAAVVIVALLAVAALVLFVYPAPLGT